MYIYIYILKTYKCKVMIIVNKNSITQYLYKNYIKHEYLKTYQTCKNKAFHYVITNY